jgi:hypothetical protein
MEEKNRFYRKVKIGTSSFEHDVENNGSEAVKLPPDLRFLSEDNTESKSRVNSDWGRFYETVWAETTLIKSKFVILTS